VRPLFGFAFTLLGLLSGTLPLPAGEPKEIRVGIIGLDAHGLPFTEILNGPKKTGELAGLRVVAAYPGGSADVPASREILRKSVEPVRKLGVEILDSVDAVLAKSDAVMILSIDGRVHLEQARATIAAGKPFFTDKPVAASLADTIRIFDLARQAGVPCFSSSSLRYSQGFYGMRDNKAVGEVLGCDAYGPNTPLEPSHPDLFYYGIHGSELLFTIMGPGCVSVSRTRADDADFVVGVWTGGRVATLRGIRQGATSFGATVFGTKGILPAGKFEGYAPLLVEIARFFRTGKPPIQAEQTLEIYAFMEAADESKRQGGRPVTLESVLGKARAAAVHTR
jgi:predicted dehydrogenase